MSTAPVTNAPSTIQHFAGAQHVDFLELKEFGQQALGGEPIHCDCDHVPKSETLAKQNDYEAAYRHGWLSTVRFLISRGASFDNAEELAQAAWVKGWERLAQLRDPHLLNSWINSIALNMQRGTCRRPGILPLRERSEFPHWDLELDIDRALESLRADDRQRIEKRYFEGLDIREIANSEGSTEGAVRIRLLRSRRKVGRALVS